MKERRTRGTGRCYQHGHWWYVAYYAHGRLVRENTHVPATVPSTKAEKLLAKRLTELTDGRYIGPKAERVTFSQLAQLIVDDYIINTRKSLPRVRQALAHLRPFFG